MPKAARILAEGAQAQSYSSCHHLLTSLISDKGDTPARQGGRWLPCTIKKDIFNYNDNCICILVNRHSHLPIKIRTIFITVGSHSCHMHRARDLRETRIYSINTALENRSKTSTNQQRIRICQIEQAE